MTFHPSGVPSPPGEGATGQSGATGAILRLLPGVHHPPARVLVLGRSAEAEARALYARGYRVALLDPSPPRVPGVEPIVGDLPTSDLGGAFDVVLDSGHLDRVRPEARPAWAAAVVRALRPGGMLLGTFREGDVGDDGSGAFGVTASELLALLGPAFDTLVLRPGFAAPGAPAARLEGVFARR